MKGNNEMITKTPTQEELHKMYLQQQTPEGQAALKVKRELLQKFRNINGITLLNTGEVQPLYDGKTGEIKQYFISL